MKRTEFLQRLGLLFAAPALIPFVKDDNNYIDLASSTFPANDIEKSVIQNLEHYDITVNDDEFSRRMNDGSFDYEVIELHRHHKPTSLKMNGCFVKGTGKITLPDKNIDVGFNTFYGVELYNVPTLISIHNTYDNRT